MFQLFPQEEKKHSLPKVQPFPSTSFRGTRPLPRNIATENDFLPNTNREENATNQKHNTAESSSRRELLQALNALVDVPLLLLLIEALEDVVHDPVDHMTTLHTPAGIQHFNLIVQPFLHVLIDLHLPATVFRLQLQSYILSLGLKQQILPLGHPLTRLFVLKEKEILFRPRDAIYQNRRK